MKITDLDYLSSTDQPEIVEGASSFASASSSSFASKGISTSSFEAVAAGKISAATVVGVSSFSVAKGKQSINFSSALVIAKARS
ncbi:MAG: hypothetical protein ACR2FS_16580 [Phormidesmis sp.]